jgi:tetratricopeptide (TPR) repeat protein
MFSLQLESPDSVAALPGSTTPTRVSDFDDFRAEIARLIGRQELAQARELAHSAVQRFPAEEITWVMLALVCQVQQDWPGARNAYEQVMLLQKPAITALVYLHYVRVLRCLGKTALADEVVEQACAIWPEDRQLQAERKNLTAGENQLPAGAGR